MSAVDIAVYSTIAVVAGALVIWFIFYSLSGQTKPPSNLTEGTLKRLIGAAGRATSDITGFTGTVFVNSEEYSAKSLEGTILKGSLVTVTETQGLTLLVKKA